MDHRLLCTKFPGFSVFISLPPLFWFERSAGLKASMSSELWALLAGRRDEAVDAHLASDRFDPLALHPEHQVPPLVALIAHELRCPNGGIFPRWCNAFEMDPYEPGRQELRMLALAKKMLEGGADPNQIVAATSKFSLKVSQSAHSYYEEDDWDDLTLKKRHWGDLKTRAPTEDERDENPYAIDDGMQVWEDLRTME